MSISLAIEIDCSFSCYFLWEFHDEMNILRMCVDCIIYMQGINMIDENE